MNSQTDLSTSIHLCSLPFQFRELNFRCCCRIGSWYIELEIKLIFDQLVNVPTLALPVSSFFICWFDSKPIKITCFIDFNVLDQSLKFLLKWEEKKRWGGGRRGGDYYFLVKVGRFVYLFETLWPIVFISRSGFDCEERDLLHSGLGSWIPFSHFD